MPNIPAESLSYVPTFFKIPYSWPNYWSMSWCGQIEILMYILQPIFNLNGMLEDIYTHVIHFFIFIHRK